MHGTTGEIQTAECRQMKKKEDALTETKFQSHDWHESHFVFRLLLRRLYLGLLVKLTSSPSINTAPGLCSLCAHS